MIGLEYILNLFNMQHNELAEKLGIKKQNINLWVKNKQKIPKKHIPKLSSIFGIEEDYFQKELTKIDELNIQNLKIQNEMQYELIDDMLIDDDGNVVHYQREVEVIGEEDVLSSNQTKIDFMKAIKEIEISIDTDNSENISDIIHQMSSRTEVLKLLAEILQCKNYTDNFMKKVLFAVLIHFNERNDTGFGQQYEGYEDDEITSNLVKAMLNKRK